MPKSAFLHKKSLLDTFKDDYKVTNPIKAARAERTWENPIVRHKREREINKWAHSFAGKKHIRKLTRFNATHEELMNEANRLRYPLEDVAKVANDALRTFRTRMWRVDVYNRFLADGTEIGTAVATDIAHRNFPYRWEFRGDLVARLMKGDEIVEEFHANDLDDLHEFLLDEGEVNEGNMKNEKDEPTYVWFGLEPDVDGESTDTIAVFVDDVHDGMVTTYAHIGQHSDASLDYVADLEADPNPKGDLYRELIGQGYDNLVVVNTDVAEDMLGIRMHPDDDARELEDPDKYDKYEAREVKTAWTYLGELEKLEGADSRKDAQSKLLKALGFTQGTEGRWYDGEGDLIDIIDELDNAEWDFAVKTCGPLQESKKSESYYKGKDRGFLVLVQKLIADNWYAGARKKFPSLTLDCYEMDGAGDDMKICFEAYGEEIDDPMSEGLMEVAEESAKKGCADANRSTDSRIADYGLEANFISWDEPDVFRDQWSYVINLSSKPKGAFKQKETYSDELHGYFTGSPIKTAVKVLKDYLKDCGYTVKKDPLGRIKVILPSAEILFTIHELGFNTGKLAYFSVSGPFGKHLGNIQLVNEIEPLLKKVSTQTSESVCADEKLSYEKGHKNSKGEPAPWVIRSHEDNSVIASFAKKEDAYAHLQRMKQYSKTEGLDSYIKDVKALLKSKYGIDVDNGKQAPLYYGWMEKLDACHYKGMSAEDCAVEVAGFLGAKKGETFTGRPQNYSYARIGHEVSTKWIDSVVGDLQDTLKEYNRLSGESVGVAAFTDDAKVDWELYLVGDDKEILHFVDALGYTKLMNKYPRLVDFDKVFVQHGSLDDLTNYGIMANPYPGTMFDTPKKESKKAEGLEKNGVIVVPEWLWVAYETGDSKFLSIEEMQILDGFKAMAAGKVFDAEAEPSFRAFNDFDDYAGNCYEVQVYTIKEGK